MTSIKNLKELKEEIEFLHSQREQDFLALKVEA
jgi:hypothetical protein